MMFFVFAEGELVFESDTLKEARAEALAAARERQSPCEIYEGANDINPTVLGAPMKHVLTIE